MIKLTVQQSPVKMVGTKSAAKMRVELAAIVSVGIPYDGDYTVTPSAESAVVLPTKNKMLKEDITVQKIPYYETANPTGETVYIASEV